MRLLHSWLRLQLAAEHYRSGRGDDGAASPERGANGFDLHALDSNLCRCTGYRSIRDTAFALGTPADDDPVAARWSAPPPVVRPTRLASPWRRSSVPPA